MRDPRTVRTSERTSLEDSGLEGRTIKIPFAWLNIPAPKQEHGSIEIIDLDESVLFTGDVELLDEEDLLVDRSEPEERLAEISLDEISDHASQVPIERSLDVSPDAEQPTSRSERRRLISVVLGSFFLGGLALFWALDASGRLTKQGSSLAAPNLAAKPHPTPKFPVVLSPRAPAQHSASEVVSPVTPKEAAPRAMPVQSNRVRRYRLSSTKGAAKSSHRIERGEFVDPFAK